MTRRQLQLLLEYIGLRAEIARKTAKGEGVSPHSYDDLKDITAELEELCTDE